MPYNLKPAIIFFICCLGVTLLPNFGHDRQMLAANEPADTAFFVASNGNDTWSGTVAEPNSTKTDGPFATLKQARDVLRKLKAKGSIRAGATVSVRGGTYYLDETFTLGPEDSGTENHPIRYVAYKNERPILTGSREIKGFKTYKGEILYADVRGTGLEKSNFRQLFANGHRQILARFPNFNPDNPYGGGFLYVEDTTEKESKRRFKYQEGTVHNWARPQEGEVVIFPGHNYWNNIIPIADIDSENRVINLADDTSYAINEGNRYYIQNFLEELDSPGEWYLDNTRKLLYFWPPGDIHAISVSAPLLKTVVEIRNSPSTKQSPENIMFIGFTVEGCEGRAIVLSGAKNCLIARNTIFNTGGDGIDVKDGFSIGIVGNDVYQTGGAGIRISGGDRKMLTPSGNHATNNYVHHTGIFVKYSSSVECSGVGNVISHNLIHDAPRIGISFDGNENIIEYNHVHHVNQETQDSGIIYSCARDWTKRGNVVQFNYVHDSGGYGRNNAREEWRTPFYTWGIYLDDWSSGTKVYGNIVARTYYGGVVIHGGRDNIIENNILVEGLTEQVRYQAIPATDQMLPAMFDKIKEMNYAKYSSLDLIRDAKKDATMSGNKFLRNIIYYSNENSVLYNISELDLLTTKSDYNTIFHSALPLIIPYTKKAKEHQWDAWRERGFDLHSIVADPLFTNVVQGDYRLKANSPALALGFRPIPVEKIGLFKHPLRTSWPVE